MSMILSTQCKPRQHLVNLVQMKRGFLVGSNINIHHSTCVYTTYTLHIDDNISIVVGTKPNNSGH